MAFEFQILTSSSKPWLPDIQVCRSVSKTFESGAPYVFRYLKNMYMSYYTLWNIYKSMTIKRKAKRGNKLL